MLTGTALLGLLSANAGAVRAVPSTHKLYVNNQLADVAAYNIAGNNYFKLRDIAKLVGFGVAYDPQVNSVALASNQPYQDDGSGGGAKATVQATDNAQPSPQTIYVDGAQQSPTVYNINGNNYFKLRDIGQRRLPEWILTRRSPMRQNRRHPPPRPRQRQTIPSRATRTQRKAR